MDSIDLDDSPDNETSWRGCSMQEIYRNLSEWELRHIPPIQPSESHAVLYYFPIKNLCEPPKPLRQHEKWDSSHVRLPCATQSQYPVEKSDGSTAIESRWELIQRAFVEPIHNSRQLEAAILSYNSKYKKIWKFRALHKLFDEASTEEEEKAFFENIVPKIVALALKLPELVMAPIPLLKQGHNRSVSLSQQQIACLLANAFLCTFPRRNTMKKQSEYSTFPDINFSRLFQSSGPQVMEKIKCICHYFRRVCTTEPLGVVTFMRRAMSEKELPKWQDCTAPLGATPLHVSSAGTIEDQGKGLLQVDFANKFLGGGVLGSGCVQEEIRFVICPELLISKLFTEALKPTEALIMVGCEQFSKYNGYASSFTWAGNYIDRTPMDESRRRQCNIIAIDALHFVQSSHQYREEWILRELNKAYVGFVHPLDTPAPGVASGNWGCGAFGGEASLKALIQLMACTITKRPLVYFTFGNIELRDAIYDVHTFFIENNVTVKQLWSYLKEFRNHKLPPNDLYGFIYQLHCDKRKVVNEGKASSSWRWPTFAIRRRKLVEKTVIRDKASYSETDVQNSSSVLRVTVEENLEKELIIDETDDEDVHTEELEAINVDSLLTESRLDHEEKQQHAVTRDKPEEPAKAEVAQLASQKEKPKTNLVQRSLLDMLDFDYKRKNNVTNTAKKPRH